MKKQKILLAAFVVLLALSLKTSRAVSTKMILYPATRTSQAVVRTKAYYQQNDRYDVLQKKNHPTI